MREPRASIQELLDETNDFALCDKIFERICELRGNKLDVAAETEYERVVTLVWHSDGIIGNGGFQYLFEGNFNGDPGFVYTAAALRKIGCQARAEAFEDALALFPSNTPPTDLQERLTIYQKVPESERNRIDHKFWRAEADMVARLAAFIRDNRNQLDNLP